MGARLTERPEGLAVALRAPAMVAALEGKMRKAQAYAMEIAPVRSGRYKFGAILLGPHNDPTGVRRHRARGRFERLPAGAGGGFHIESGIRRGKAYARLVNTTPYAVYLEFGTRYMRRQRILGRAADALKR